MRLFFGAIAAVAVIAAMAFYVANVGKWEIEAAVAEADRLDPGWRFADLEAAREAVPDGENSAPLALAAGRLLPANWTAATMPNGKTLNEWLSQLSPTKPPDAAELLVLRAERARAAAALDKARQVADRPRGRYAVAWSDDLVGTLMPHVDRARAVARLLTVDALVRTRDGDIEGAVRSCRAALNVGRSFGDEPAEISQFVRVLCDYDTVRALERTLAAGTVGPESLKGLQGLLTDEGTQPFLLRAMRAHRVGYYQSLELMRTRQLDRASYRLTSSRLGPFADEMRDQFLAGRSEAAYLRWTTALVEAAKHPTEEQDALLREPSEPKQELPSLVRLLTRGADPVRAAQRYNRTLAEARSAAAALAAERYRLDEHRWPERLDDLVPKYLAAVPADPFDGQPLRLRRLPDGIVVYSVGPSRGDDGGKLDHGNPEADGIDMGFQLWDARPAAKLPGAKQQ